MFLFSLCKRPAEMFGRAILLLSLCTVIRVVQCLRTPCPMSQALPYCECTLSEIKQTADVDCRGLLSLQNLTVVSNLMREIPVNHFFLSNSVIGHLAGETFYGNHINRLEISSTQLIRLSENGRTAFMGLESNLRDLVLRFCGLTSDMEWDVFRKLESLNSMDFSFNPLDSVSDEMFSNPPPNLHELYLKNCSLKYLGPKAFANIESLVVLDLSENLIAQVSRSMLPLQAIHLHYLYFSYNNLKDIPDNFFQDMRSLSTIYVNNNHLRSLPQSLWEIIWKNSLRTIDTLGNDLECDQSLCWLTFEESSFLRGSCADPDALRGRRLVTLWPWEVGCNESYYHGEMTLPRKPRY